MDYFVTKKHKYLTLDAIRGIAATFVLSIHFGVLFGGLHFPHAYLAVDMFFVMSGFVISAAYDADIKSGKLTIADFLRIRAVRLYPLYFLALVISIYANLHNAIEHPDSTFSWMSFFIKVLCGILLIPSPLPGWGYLLFPLNSPSWSIFFEVVANGVYAKFRRYQTNKMLLGVMFGAGAILILFVFIQHSMSFVFSWRNGVGGIPRVIYSFAAGLMVYRIRNNLPFKTACNSLLSLLVLAVAAVSLALPVERYSEWYDLAVVLFIFPALVLLASYIEPSSGLGKIYAVLGLTSYAIYILQVPLISAFPIIYKLPGFLAGFLLFVVAFVIDLYYDQPVRRWMRKRWLMVSLKTA